MPPMSIGMTRGFHDFLLTTKFTVASRTRSQVFKVSASTWMCACNSCGQHLMRMAFLTDSW
eukprot:10394377-Alexandrium_andersonii.AAC.1